MQYPTKEERNWFSQRNEDFAPRETDIRFHGHSKGFILEGYILFIDDKICLILEWLIGLPYNEKELD